MKSTGGNFLMIGISQASFCMLLVTLCASTVRAFQVSVKSESLRYSARPFDRVFSIRNSQQTEISSPETSSNESGSQDEGRTGVNAEAARLRAEADKIRLEAERMDSALTLHKIEVLEQKLRNSSWLARNPDEVESLKKQIDTLNDKLSSRDDAEKTSNSSAGSRTKSAATERKDDMTISLADPIRRKSEDARRESAEKSSLGNTKVSNRKDEKTRLQDNPLSGYDEADLELYIPVVNAIEEQMPNATLEEKLEAFRAAPELQEHFQKKIHQMVLQPIQDMQKLETLKQDYLASSSSVEKKQIKREMEQLEKSMENESPFIYSDSVLYADLPTLTEEEIQQRLDAVGKLHPILRALYKKRCGVNETGDLRLAIELDHYEPQIQLLEQVRYVEPVTDEMRGEIRLGFLSLPDSVRNHVAKNLGLENGKDVSAVIEALTEKEQEEWMPLHQVAQMAGGESVGSTMSSPMANLPEYADIEFLDRSRFIQEFIPAVTRLEAIHPPMEDIDLLMKEVLDRRIYTVTSKPERVIGGYYIYGQNQLSDSVSSNNVEMVSKLQERLQKSSLKDRVDLFYIQDPTPPSDEEYEVGEIDRPVLLVTAKNRELLYNPSAPLTKVLMNSMSLLSTLLFSLATIEMQPAMRDQLTAVVTGDSSMDILPLLNKALFVGASILATQLAHEMGHQIIAWRGKFEVGLPTLVPSIQIGLQGAITSFKSPPPSNKYLFDFSITGPLLGMLVSFIFLVAGLNITSTIDISEANMIPALPIFLLKSSALGGGLIEYFVGKGTLMSAAADSVLPLHPFAIAGFVGILSNALALLPLGHTDGGRIAVTMFGRRGAFLVKAFTAVILCAIGIVGFDEPRLFLTYVLFAMIWQRELEAPTLNEADDLDFPRGLVGIGTAIIVLLSLMPMV